MSGTVITFHPLNESIYFVGTKIGFIVKVSNLSTELNFILSINIADHTMFQCNK